MKPNRKVTKQRPKRALLFPVGIFKEIGHVFKYIYLSLTLSMRKKISFDYGILYWVATLLTISIVLVGFSLYDVQQKSEEIVEGVFEMVVPFEMGVYNMDALTYQLESISAENNIGVQVIMSRQEREDIGYTITSDAFAPSLYRLSFIDRIPLLFNEGLIIRSANRYYKINDHYEVDYKITTIHNIKSMNKSRMILGALVLFGQLIGFMLMSIIGSIRLKQVFKPIYTMTKAAEKISINDVEGNLDVSRAKYELKDLALTFNDMLDRIRSDYDKQKRFVSDVSHELRTPISIVNGYVRMLDRWGKEDEAILEEAIDAIKSESKNMQVLVENLLTLVRSDNQTLKFEKEIFDIGKLATEIMKDMEMVDEGNHTFICDIQMDLLVCLDYAKIKQTFRIFIDNAMKYTPEGGKITFKLKQEYSSVIISIIDTGIGVEKNDLPYLFDRFYRSDESRTRQTGGHGLGLSIAKAMIIGQNGMIRVKSKVQEGSAFIISLPVNTSETCI
ncbi:sensor histidine kinase [Petrocella sp. FN5]|uniref:sensor histidine kinase n=1 Tax=Petrocella sp. FN5 TaxID=3032002 RepID=UPI0023DA1182|nr:HAMP domain-containing sensor histidine kinase [Petrocella sp. FN5]MDF1616538.1 ATP-binding protein [Petrocella sp. FN5]